MGKDTLMVSDIIQYSEFTCGIILLIFAVLQLIYKNRQGVNYNIAVIYFCLSYIILAFWSFKSGLVYHVPWLLHTDLAAPYVLGPMVYFYLGAVTGAGKKSRIGFSIHFAPAVLVFAILAGGNILDNFTLEYYRASNALYPDYNINPVTRWINIISNFYMMLYFLITMKEIYVLLRVKTHKSIRELMILFYYMSFVMLFGAMLIIASIIRNNMLNITAIYLLTLSGIWYFIFSFRYPELTQKAIKEARTLRYENSMLKGIDPDVILERLDELMDDEKLFLDYDLSLQKLSEELMITPHQLSKILNSKRKMNFRTLLNSYRITEAKLLMKQYPDKNILEIAMESGFNSKSSFNSVFSRETGIAPRDYRKALRN